jgi:uncharacterized protein (DUF849 family)
MEKLIIQVRVNEGQMRDVTPHVPYSPEEIADQAVECWRHGATVVHYHAREPESGAPSSDPDLYADVVRRIKKECDLITFPTLGASLLPTAEERLAHILEMAKDPAIRPDCIPVDMLTTNLDRYHRGHRKIVTSGDRVYLNTVNMLRYLCESARAAGVKPVSMIWNVAGIRLTEAFLEMGLYEEPLMCELSLFGDGFDTFGHPATVKGLQALLDFLPAANWPWMVDVIGANSFPVLAHAIGCGGHVAIGVADHPYRELGLPTNVELVDRVVELARSMGREVASATEAREVLGLA